MTYAKQICLITAPTAYYSGFGGIEVHRIDHEINDYLICKSGAWTGRRNHAYHRLLIRYTATGRPYVLLHGCRIHLDECIRMEPQPQPRQITTDDPDDPEDMEELPF